MKLQYHILLLLLMIGFNVKAQPAAKIQNKITALKIGDQVPEVELKMVNYAKPTLKLSELKSRAIIIDFWATWCQPCVASFPKQGQIGNKYKEKLMILPVSHEKAEIVTPFLERMNHTMNLKIFSAVGDQTLSKLFPHSSVPRYIWINSKGIVQGVSAELLENDVDAFVKNDAIALPVFNDMMRASINNKEDLYEKLLSTMSTNEFADKVFKDTSMHSFKLLRQKFSPASQSGFTWNRNFLIMSNMSLTGLFKVAYREGMSYFSGMDYTRLITSDSSKFTDSYGAGHHDVRFRMDWVQKHGLNYILKVPDSLSDKKWEIFRSDLAAAFPEVKAWIEKEDRSCLVLKRLPNSENLLTTKGGKPDLKTDGFLIQISNANINALTNALYKPYQAYMIFNETGIKDKVDINIQTEIGNLDALNKALKAYGLVLEKQTRKLDILIIKDGDVKS